MNVYSIYARFQPHFRRKRWKHFTTLFDVTETSHVLDVGGHPGEWMTGVDVPLTVTVVNIGPWPDALKAPPRFVFCMADARGLPFAEGQFSIAYSNSVIEHMGTFEDQKRFADEIRRVGRQLYVQTPNRWFPIEPHLICFFAHWLPQPLRNWIMPLLSFRAWFRNADDVSVKEVLNEVRLLSAREMTQLFPDCEIIRERVFGLTKSLIAVRKA